MMLSAASLSASAAWLLAVAAAGLVAVLLARGVARRNAARGMRLKEALSGHRSPTGEKRHRFPTGELWHRFPTGEAPRDAAQRPVTESSPGELLRELEESVPAIAAQLDRRLERLEKLLPAADDRIRALESLLTAPASSSLSRGACPPRPVAPSLPPSAPPVDESPASSLQSLVSGRVYHLAQMGKAPIDIAEELRLPLGEVELILRLRAFQQAGTA